MRGRTNWIVISILVAASAALLLLAQGRTGDALDHNSNNDGVHGTSALRLLAAQRGHPTSQLDIAFNPPESGLLFVFSPDSPFSVEAVERLAAFVRGGGIVVYADEQLDPRIAAEFHLRTSLQPVPTAANAATPVFANVRTVSDSTTSRPFVPTPEQAILLRNPKGPVLAVEARAGNGRLIALSAPCLLCNGFLETADNALLAAGMIGLARFGAPIVFDEFHHGALAAGVSDWNYTPFGIATWWAVAVVFLGLAIRGRAFGPRVPAPGARDRSSAEYAVAVGHLLRQAGGRALALRVATDATRRSLSERIGIRTDRPGFEKLLDQRAPELAREYGEAIAVGAGAASSEAALVKAARRLHALAYPIARTTKSRE